MCVVAMLAASQPGGNFSILGPLHQVSPTQDALFFENIRDFIGPAKGRERVGRTAPNDEIIKTITTCPGKMIERNNEPVPKFRS